MPSITKDHARIICKKLKAVQESKKSAHINYSVYYEGVYLGSFGVRHGSNRDLPHDHIPEDLDIPFHLALDLGRCSKYLDDYLNYLRDKGRLPGQPLLAPAQTQKANFSRPWDEIDWVSAQAAELARGEAESVPEDEGTDSEAIEPPSDN